MGLNCQKGDLAIVARKLDGATRFENSVMDALLGRPVRCASFFRCSCGRCEGLPSWTLEEPLVVDLPGYYAILEHLPDAMLTPLRDNRGRDQTLDWKSVPAEPLRLTGPRHDARWPGTPDRSFNGKHKVR